jgi:asparagine synthase (glutamine-hydrolysing)
MGYDPLNILEYHYNRADSDDLLSRIQYVDIKTYLPDDILTKVDRASMAVSLEVRAPLLDHELMEFAAKVPSSLKLRGRNGKYIFKKAMEPVLPPQATKRTKQGFAVPLGHWFRHELREFAHAAIFAGDDDVLNQASLHRIWNEHQQGLYDRSPQLWAILMFRKWRQAFAA